jgi:hypothetical protein
LGHGYVRERVEEVVWLRVLANPHKSTKKKGELQQNLELKVHPGNYQMASA